MTTITLQIPNKRELYSLHFSRGEWTAEVRCTAIVLDNKRNSLGGMKATATGTTIQEAIDNAVMRSFELIEDINAENDAAPKPGSIEELNQLMGLKK